MDVIIALEKMIYSGKYDINYYRNILLILQRYLKCDNCKWIFKTNSNRRTDIVSINDIENCPKYIISIDINGHIEEVILYEPRIIDDKLFEYIKVFLRNVRFFDERIKLLRIDKLVGVLNADSLMELINTKNVYDNTGVCFIDCNGLKFINDMFGHDAGDKLLITICNCIKKYVRENEIYRKGGDEFVIVCENIPQELFYNKVKSIELEILSNGCSASIGYAYREKSDNLSVMIDEADNLMYEEKSRYYMNNKLQRRK